MARKKERRARGRRRAVDSGWGVQDMHFRGVLISGQPFGYMVLEGPDGKFQAMLVTTLGPIESLDDFLDGHMHGDLGMHDDLEAARDACDKDIERRFAQGAGQYEPCGGCSNFDDHVIDADDVPLPISLDPDYIEAERQLGLPEVS